MNKTENEKREKEKQISSVKLLDKIFVGIFFSIITIGFATLFRSPKKFSYLENRALNKFEIPTIMSFMDKSFQDKVENAFSDQILYGQNIKKIGTKLLRPLDSFNINSKICQGNYVYISNDYATYDCNYHIIDTPIYYYNEDNLDKSIQIFNQINNYIDTYYYVIDRSYAWNFQEDKLSLDGYDYLKNNLLGDYHITRLSINSYNDYSKYFYRTDHHWNYLGSYEGYKDIVKLLKVEDKPLEPQKEITLKNKFYGSMAKKSKAITKYEDFTYYDFKIPKHVEYINGLKGQYGEYQKVNNTNYINLYASVYGNDYAEVVFDFNDNKKDNLLIIGTSYTNPINRLLASHYNKTYILDPRYYKKYDGSLASVKEYIIDHDIDKVLVLVSTDVLSDGTVKLEWGD